MTNRIEVTTSGTKTGELSMVISNLKSGYSILTQLIGELNQADYGSDSASVQAALGLATTADADNAFYLLNNLFNYLSANGNVFLEFLSRMG